MFSYNKSLAFTGPVRVQCEVCFVHFENKLTLLLKNFWPGLILCLLLSIWLTSLMRLIQSHDERCHDFILKIYVGGGISVLLSIWIFALQKMHCFSLGTIQNLESLNSEGLLWTGLSVGLRRILGNGWGSGIEQTILGS